MMRPCMPWAILLVGIGVWINSGCVAGVHHHRIDATVEEAGDTVDIEGSVNSVDFGIVADFRYARLAMPFEGHRRQIEVDVRDGGAFSIDKVVELRALRLDVPLWSAIDLADEPSGSWYPGRMSQRHSVELWASGSVGVTPIHPKTATVGAVYYRYGAVAVRVYGGLSSNPYSGLDRSIENGGEVNHRREGSVTGMVGGIEVTLAAGEYALELVRFIIDRDREGRSTSDRWNR